jgi:hypothetical protein
MRWRVIDWATLVVASLLMVGGLLAVALARSALERAAGVWLVLGASTIFAAPAAAVRIAGLVIALAAIGAGQLAR